MKLGIYAGLVGTLIGGNVDANEVNDRLTQIPNAVEQRIVDDAEYGLVFFPQTHKDDYSHLRADHEISELNSQTKESQKSVRELIKQSGLKNVGLEGYLHGTVDRNTMSLLAEVADDKETLTSLKAQYFAEIADMPISEYKKDIARRKISKLTDSTLARLTETVNVHAVETLELEQGKRLNTYGLEKEVLNDQATKYATQMIDLETVEQVLFRFSYDAQNNIDEFRDIAKALNDPNLKKDIELPFDFEEFTPTEYSKLLDRKDKIKEETKQIYDAADGNFDWFTEKILFPWEKDENLHIFHPKFQKQLLENRDEDIRLRIFTIAEMSEYAQGLAQGIREDRYQELSSLMSASTKISQMENEIEKTTDKYQGENKLGKEEQAESKNNRTELLTRYLQDAYSDNPLKMTAQAYSNCQRDLNQLKQKFYKIAVQDRNEAALNYSASVMANSEEKVMGIVYGSAHMDDFRERVPDNVSYIVLGGEKPVKKQAGSVFEKIEKALAELEAELK